MRVRTTDHVEIDVGDTGEPDPGDPELIALRSETVLAALNGTTLSRSVAISELNQAQFTKLFGSSGKSPKYRQAQRLRKIGTIVRDDVVRERLRVANASVDALVSVSKYRDPEAQLAQFAKFQIEITMRRRIKVDE